MSDSPGLVDFAFGLVNSVLNLPDVQVMFFEEFKLKKNCEINSACQKAFGASWNDIWASKCYNQLQKYLTHCTVFWHKWPVHDLVLVIPLHPLSKLLAIQDHTQNLEEQLWMGGRREVSIIFYRPVTRSDLKRERSFFRGLVSHHFCKWL